MVAEHLPPFFEHHGTKNQLLRRKEQIDSRRRNNEDEFDEATITVTLENKRLGGKVSRVYARSARASQPESIGDYALVTLGFESGAMAHIEGGWAYPKGTFRTSLDIAGSEGLIEWHSDDSSTVKSFLETRATDADAVGIPSSVLTEDPYTTQIKHFKHAITSNAPFDVTPENALAALEIALAARESLATGQAIHLGGL